MSPDGRHEVEAFIDRWRGVAVLPGSTELATAQSFVLDLCTLLGVPPPHHAEARVEAGDVPRYRRGV